MQSYRKINQTQTKARARSKSAPRNFSTNARSNQRPRSPKPEKGIQVIQILNDLSTKINYLPIPQIQLKQLESHINDLIQIAGKHKNFISRCSADFWVKWNKFISAFYSYSNELSVENCINTTNNQLSVLQKIIESIETHPPQEDHPGLSNYQTGLTSLQQDFETFSILVNELFGDEQNQVEETIVQNSRKLLKPIMAFRQHFDEENYGYAFDLSLLGPKESTILKAKCIHSLELINESVRGLRNRINIKRELTDLLENVKIQLEKLIPPKSNIKLFDPTNLNNLTQKKRELRTVTGRRERKSLLSSREVSLILDQRKKLLKECDLPISIADNPDQISIEITKREKVLNHRKNTARSDSRRDEIDGQLKQLQKLKDFLANEKRGNDQIKEEIEILKNKVQNLDDATEIQKQVNRLRIERDDLLKSLEQAQKRQKALKNESIRKSNELMSQPQDEQILNNENSRLAEQLSYIQKEKWQLIDEMIYQKAQNDILANGQDNLIQNSNLREQKFRLLKNIQEVREEIQMLTCFQSKSDYLDNIPGTSLMSQEELINEYKATLKANSNILKQRESLKKSLQSLQKNREQLVYNSAIDELSAAKNKQVNEENGLLNELEKYSDDFHDHKKKVLTDQLKNYVIEFDNLKNHTNSTISKLRKDLQDEKKNIMSKSAKTSKFQEMNEFKKKSEIESEKEIEIIKNEIKQIENATHEIKHLMIQIQTMISESKAKKAAILAQSSVIKQNIPEEEVQDEIENLSQKNHELKLRVENAKLQLKEIDEFLGGNQSSNEINEDDANNENDNLDLIERLESIESKLCVAFDAQQQAAAELSAKVQGESEKADSPSKPKKRKSLNSQKK